MPDKSPVDLTKTPAPPEQPMPAPQPAPTLGDRLCTLYLIACGLCILAAMVFTMIDLRMAALLAGIFLLMASVPALAVIPLTAKTWEILLLPVIGLPLTAVPAYLLLSGHDPARFPPFGEAMKLLLLGVAAVGAGLLTAVIPQIKRMRLKNRCTLEVPATCVAHEEAHARGHRFYTPVWEYYAGGQVHRCTGSPTHQPEPQTGTVQMLRIDPADPGEPYRPEDRGHLAFLAVGVCLVIVGGVLLGAL